MAPFSLDYDLSPRIFIAFYGARILKVRIDIPNVAITAMLWQLVSLNICIQIGAEQQRTEMSCLAHTSSFEAPWQPKHN